MLKVKTVLRIGKILLGSLLVAGLAGPAFAGNVWSWRTEDGSFAFTDDSKRIPAKHRAEAKRKSMGKLTRYERFTKVSADVDGSYTDRIRARQSTLRARTETASQGVVLGAVRTNDQELAFAIPASGGRGRAGSGTSVILPLAQNQASSDSEPTTIESIRVKPRDSLASRHWTVVKKGDRVISVIKGEMRQRKLDGPSESDFDL